jgi:hypothetical protein
MELPVCQDRGSSEFVFEVLESHLTGRCPEKTLSCFSRQVKQGSRKLGVVLDVSAIIIRESKELSQLLYVLWSRVCHHSSGLVRISPHPSADTMCPKYCTSFLANLHLGGFSLRYAFQRSWKTLLSLWRWSRNVLLKTTMS